MDFSHCPFGFRSSKICFHSGFLSIQRVSIHLYRGGYSRVNIYFYLVFFHIVILIRAAVCSTVM